MKVDIVVFFNVDYGFCLGVSRGSEGGNNWFREIIEVGGLFRFFFYLLEDWSWVGFC